MREQRQEEAVRAYLNDSDGQSIINACPRFGKIKVAIDIMRELGITNPMILAPRKDIEKGWKDDFKKFGVTGGYDFRTFASIKGFTYFSHRLLIIDEPHELSVNQQKLLKPHIDKVPRRVLALTGTLTQKTRTELYDNLNLDVCYKYSIDEGVEEGILADYQLYIHKVKLARLENIKFRKMLYAKDHADNALARHFITLKMINLIQNSEAKRLKTYNLIETSKGERVLVFCGVTKVADNLGIPVYHSKAKEKKLFIDFCEGKGNALATIKMMQAGITVTPINKGIINYMSGNPEDSAQKICRFLGLEYNNPLKKAEIHIVSSDEQFETERLKTGLAFFDQSKITII